MGSDRFFNRLLGQAIRFLIVNPNRQAERLMAGVMHT